MFESGSLRGEWGNKSGERKPPDDCEKATERYEGASNQRALAKALKLAPSVAWNDSYRISSPD
jgi:hypothetical protein